MATIQRSSMVSADNGSYSAQIDPTWDAWGPCGGYLASIAMRAVEHVAPGDHRPVTLSCQYLKMPKHGAVAVEVNASKVGSANCYNVEFVQNEIRVVQAQIWTAAERPGPEICDLSMPQVPGPEELKPITEHLGKLGQNILPIWQNMEGRPVNFSPNGVPDPKGHKVERWLRFTDWEESVSPFQDAMRSLVIIDSHVWVAFSNGVEGKLEFVAPSLDLTVWFHSFDPAENWLLANGRSDVAASGFVNGQVEVWTQSGKLLATGGSQCLAIQMK